MVEKVVILMGRGYNTYINIVFEIVYVFHTTLLGGDTVLIAKVTFTDVDGKSICENYTGMDVEDLVDRVGYNITDEYNYPRPNNPKFKGLNGVIDINKPINILITPDILNE